MKKLLSVFITLIFLIMPLNAFSEDFDGIISETSKHILTETINPAVSSIGGEWAVVGLARYNYSENSDFFDKYLNNLQTVLCEKGGILHKRKYTEYSRVVLALTSIGKNPENIFGFNLLMPLADFDKTIWQGTNGPCWALIALDSGDYDIPDNPEVKTRATRKMYVDKLLSLQNSDGGWGLSSNSDSDIDITAMVLTALSKYKNQDEVAESINSGLLYLSLNQNQSGGFSVWGNENSESASQVIVALNSLEISLDDERFVKNGNTVLSNLLTFYDGKGGFLHTKDGITNQMATEQAFYALVSVKRSNDGMNNLYDMTDTKPPFWDVDDGPSKEKIEMLYNNKVISGKKKGVFEPKSFMTRAEFATIVTKALNLEVQETKIFDDVSENDWYFKYISAAYKNGIVNGVSDKEFNPNGLITREEACVMLKRASLTVGMKEEGNFEKSFSDFGSASEWAKSGIMFCISNNILEKSGQLLNPGETVNREEIAVMIYNMLHFAKLI